MEAERSVVPHRVEYGQDHFKSAIGQLDDDSQKILEDLKAQLEKTPFNVIGQESGENPEVDILIQSGLGADIPFPFIDFVILNSIPDEGEKQLRLMLIHDTYLGSMLYPAHAILCASQDFDLTEGMPFGPPLFTTQPEVIAR